LIKNIIFDLGNVLLNFKPEILVNQITNDVKRTIEFIQKIIRNKIWVDLDKGLLTLDEAYKIYLAQFPEEQDILKPFFANWIDYLTPIYENVNILKILKQKDFKIYILSNAMVEAYNVVRKRYDFFSLVDGEIISGIEKVGKPEPSIYKLLIKRYNLVPEESLFLDDVLANLRPAKKLGINTIWINPQTDIRAELRDFDIII
jgi:putative hydrolase of the HAD superfamily